MTPNARPSAQVYYTPSPQPQHCTSLPRSPDHSYLNNPIHPLRDHIAQQPKTDQTTRDPKEPIQIVHILAGDNAIHAPDTCDDVHRQDNSAEHGKLAEDVGSLLLALIHADVDLGQIIGMSSAQQTMDR
jgi:hypothetical protein